MRVTVPDDQIAVLMPVLLAQNLYLLCNALRKTKRLKVEPTIYAIAGEIMLAVLASEEIMVLPKAREQ